MKRYGLSAMRWKAEFLKVKHTEDLEKDVVRQSIKHLPRFLSRIFRRAADRWLICLKENQPKHGKNEREKHVFLERLQPQKLLVPMIMMLIVVMAIVMIPAFMSFYGET